MVACSRARDRSSYSRVISFDECERTCEQEPTGRTDVWEENATWDVRDRSATYAFIVSQVFRPEVGLKFDDRHVGRFRQAWYEREMEVHTSPEGGIRWEEESVEVDGGLHRFCAFG